MIRQIEAIAQMVRPMTTTDPSSGSSAPKHTYSTSTAGMTSAGALSRALEEVVISTEA